MSVRPIFASLALVATAVTVAASAPASAEMFAPKSVTVSYADLDLATADGKGRLDGRIGRAAAMVCGVSSRELAQERGIQACRTDAVADARAQIATVVAFNGAGGGGIKVARR